MIIRVYFPEKMVHKTPYKTTHFYAVRGIRALKMSTKMLQRTEICLEYRCKNLKHTNK